MANFVPEPVVYRGSIGPLAQNLLVTLVRLAEIVLQLGWDGSADIANGAFQFRLLRFRGYPGADRLVGFLGVDFWVVLTIGRPHLFDAARGRTRSRRHRRCGREDTKVRMM
jgi:hypothetical protein